MINEIKQLSNEKKQHLAAVVMGTIMVLAAIYFLVIRSAQESVAKIHNEIAEAEKKYSEASKLVKSSDAEEEKLARREEQLAGIEAGMVAGDPNLWIRLTFDKFRAQAPYKVEIPNFPTPSMGDMAMIPEFPYKAATYRVTGSAYYHDLGKFLSEFENFFPYIRVLNLDLSPEEAATSTSAGDDREKLLFSFEIVVLVKPPKKS